MTEKNETKVAAQSDKGIGYSEKSGRGRLQLKKTEKCENFSQVGDTPPIKMLTGNGTKRWRWLGLVMALSICIGNIFSSRLSDRKCQVEVRDRQKCHQQVNIQM